MAVESNTKFYVIEAPIMWAKVFEHNRDKYEGNENTDGATKVTVLLNDEQKDELIKNGAQEVALGYQMFKPTEHEGKQMWAYNLKRAWIHPTWTDKETGERVVLGEPQVFDYNQMVEDWEAADRKGYAKDYIKKWEGGLIGNGTIAKVKYSIYSGKNKAGKPISTVRLEAVGIVKLVEYVSDSADGVRF